MSYVDGFVIPLPKKNVEAYRKIARKAGKIWREYGALEYRECVGDDLNVQMIQATFPRLVKLKPGETVVFSWILYKSRTQRDRINSEGDEGSTHRRHEAPKHAVRRQADVLRWVQDAWWSCDTTPRVRRTRMR